MGPEQIANIVEQAGLAGLLALALTAIAWLVKKLFAQQKIIQDMGGDMTGVYLTMGGYDLVVILEAPSDEVVAKFALTLGSQGNVRTTTLKAFSEAEFGEIVAGLP